MVPYTIYGDTRASRCLVFYHGTLLSSQGMFRQFMLQVLHQKDADTCIIAFDRPGYGPEVQDADIQRTVAEHARIIEQLGKTPLAVIGHSGGSLIACQLARALQQNHPDLRLILVAPTCSDNLINAHVGRRLQFWWLRNLFIHAPALANRMARAFGWLNKRWPSVQADIWAKGADAWVKDDTEFLDELRSSIQYSADHPDLGRGLWLDYQSFTSVWQLSRILNAYCFSFDRDPITPVDMVGSLAVSIDAEHHYCSGGHFTLWSNRSGIWWQVLDIIFG